MSERLTMTQELEMLREEISRLKAENELLTNMVSTEDWIHEIAADAKVSALKARNEKLERVMDALDYECSKHANPCECELCDILKDCEAGNE